VLEDMGDLQITDCDDANIPVNCFLSNEDGNWVWTASNFMPRKGYVSEDGYKLLASTKEEILDLINKHVTPLYERALAKIKTGELYYW
jgi:hypothetical protein